MLDDPQLAERRRGEDAGRTAGTSGVLQEMFRYGGLQVSQTPLVDIETGIPVAVRVVTHGGPDRPDASPGRLRTLIAESDLTASLDEANRARALTAARQQPLLRGVPLVLDAHLASFPQLVGNEEPTGVVLVIDANDALERPAGTMRLVAAARGLGWEIGLREVGRTAAGVAAVAVLEPGLVVLSPRVLRERTSRLSVETLQATTAYSHSSGAAVAVADIADEATEAAALAVGATLACGPLYERRRLAHPRETDPEVRLFTPPLPVPHQSPFELAARRHGTRRARKDLLVALSQRLEAVAEPAGRSTVVLSAFQTVRHVTADTRRRYARLGRTSSLVLVAAEGLRGPVADGVSTAALDPSDPLVNEWNVVVLAPTAAAMLVAAERRGPADREADREFDYVLSFERDLVAHAARSMLGRLTQRAAPVLPPPG